MLLGVTLTHPIIEDLLISKSFLKHLTALPIFSILMATKMVQRLFVWSPASLGFEWWKPHPGFHHWNKFFFVFISKKKHAHTHIEIHIYTVLKEIVYVINVKSPSILGRMTYKEYIAFVHHSFLVSLKSSFKTLQSDSLQTWPGYDRRKDSFSTTSKILHLCTAWN